MSIITFVWNVFSAPIHFCWVKSCITSAGWHQASCLPDDVKYHVYRMLSSITSTRQSQSAGRSLVSCPAGWSHGLRLPGDAEVGIYCSYISEPRLHSPSGNISYVISLILSTAQTTVHPDAYVTSHPIGNVIAIIYPSPDYIASGCLSHIMFNITCHRRDHIYIIYSVTRIIPSWIIAQFTSLVSTMN